MMRAARSFPSAITRNRSSMRRCGSGFTNANMTTTWSTLAATMRSPCAAARRAARQRRTARQNLGDRPIAALLRRLEKHVVADGKLQGLGGRRHGVAAKRTVLTAAGVGFLQPPAQRRVDRFSGVGSHAPHAARSLEHDPVCRRSIGHALSSPPSSRIASHHRRVVSVPRRSAISRSSSAFTSSIGVRPRASRASCSVAPEAR